MPIALLLRLTFLFLFLVACLPALGQQVVFSKVSPPEGVNLVNITGLAQDKQGFLWIASDL